MQLEGGWGRPTDAVPLTTVAAFLIARGPSAAIVLPPYDRPMLATPFKLEGVDADADPGRPLGPGAKGPGGVYTRRYERAEVTLNCTSFEATVLID